MVYRLVIHGSALRSLKASLQTRLADVTADPSVVTFQSADGTIQESFRPIRVAAGLDQGRAEVKEGMRLTFHFLKEMDLACRQNGCVFAVVIIPTKETVFAQHLRASQGLNLADKIETVIANEPIATAELERVLDEAGIPHVNALPALRKRLTEQLYYRGPADMHPGANGYRVIGETVVEFLATLRARGRDAP
jgi:hypothetical protein